MTDDLVAFLRARLDEDEQAARAASWEGAAHWRATGDPRSALDVIDSNGVHVVYDEGRPSAGQVAHIACWDPARVLAEVDAKRRLLTAITTDVQGMAELIVSEWGEGGYESAPGKLLCLLALPYAAHPDYRPEWAPDA